MAKKANTLKKTTKPAIAPEAGIAASTPVRNTAIPKVVAAPVAKKEITHAMIAQRAFEISCGPNCGSEVENWLRAERELKGL